MTTHFTKNLGQRFARAMGFSNENNSREDDIFHDDESAAIIHRVLSSQVVYVLSAEDSVLPDNQKIYELRVDISYDEVISLCSKMKTLFMASEALLKIESEKSIIVVADLHGQIVHLLRIFQTCGLPPAQKYVFLGDYVDRGVQGIPLICFLFALKHRYPNHVYLLRGNHEDVNTTLNYGFYDECVGRYGESPSGGGEEIWQTFMETFNCMPLAAVIGTQVFCAHGGISPFMDTIEDIRKFERPSIVPAYGLACDLLWSDPTSNPEREGWSLSHRGISFTYGYDAVEEFCSRNNISLIIRGHQLFKELYPAGYILRFGGRLISLFSALNYENHRNNAAVIKLSFDKKLEVSPIVFRCRHYIPQKPYETISYKDMEAIRKDKLSREDRPTGPVKLPSAKFDY